MKLINYDTNTATKETITNHLMSCNSLFIPILDTTVDIESYAQKIKNYAFTFEAWVDGELAGLIACYLNDSEKKNGFISNVSVLEEFQGKGLARTLLNQTIKKALELGFRTLSLDVELNNTKAISLYQSVGFVLNQRISDKYKMQIRLTENKNILVSVCCTSYNHESYIRECLDSFVMQKTNFKFEVLIHDDASIDKTADIIREYEAKYPDIIKPIYQIDNQYSKGIGAMNVKFNFPRAQAKYIALCEGDDYWTDPLKLQKQVDFLEANEEYSLSFHKVEVLSEGVTSTELYNHLEEREFFAEEIYDKWTVPTCSVMFRNNFKLKWHKSIVLGDIFLFLSILEHGKAFCHGFKGAVYRRNAGSISVVENINIEKIIKIFYQYRYMYKRFPMFKRISFRKMNEYLDQLIYAPFFKGIWKFRFYKMLQEPKLFFTTFFTTTLTSYIVERKKK